MRPLCTDGLVDWDAMASEAHEALYRRTPLLHELINEWDEAFRQDDWDDIRHAMDQPYRFDEE